MRTKQKKLGPIRTHLVSPEFTRTMIKVNALMLGDEDTCSVVTID